MVTFSWIISGIVILVSCVLCHMHKNDIHLWCHMHMHHMCPRPDNYETKTELLWISCHLCTSACSIGAQGHSLSSGLVLGRCWPHGYWQWLDQDGVAVIGGTRGISK